MIYTVTLNPSIDYIMNTDELVIGKTNRSNYERLSFGGKGLNVSYVLAQLGFDSVALGFIAGQTGNMIESLANEAGINTDFIRLKNGMSRINVKVRADEETEINGSGPAVSDDEMAELCNKLDTLKKGDVLVLSGSIPKDVSADIFSSLLMRANEKGIMTVIDTSGKPLIAALKSRPFLIKPNIHELFDVLGQDFGQADCSETLQAISSAKRLQDLGAQNVLVSMGKNGAVYIDESGSTRKISAPQIISEGAVGAGDSMVAGFLAGMLKTGDASYALRLATACGSSAAKYGRLPVQEEIEEMLESMEDVEQPIL